MRQDELLQVVHEQHEQRVANIDEMRRRDRRTIAYIVIAWLLWVAVDWFFDQFPAPPGASLVTLSANAQATPQLCPGDYLEYTLAIDGDSVGAFDIAVTVYKESPPPMTVIFEERVTDIYLPPVGHTRTAAWQVPAEVIDPISGQTRAIEPGRYQRRVALLTTARNTDPAITVIPFVISEDCPQ